MTKVLLYWSNICVLHKQEKAFLERLSDRLSAENISLETRFFGLGCPEHMCEYLAKPDAVLPDLIVSADLEVFEDRRIFAKLENTLYPAADWLPLRRGAEDLRRGEKLLPFLSIPLVYYTRKPELCAEKNIAEQSGLAFGGINNSAAKTITKAVWERYGKDAAARVLNGSAVSDMPIGAFQAVRTGTADTALVPSLYALRADGRETFLQIPKEGPLLIPSYFCARSSLPESLARRMAREILCRELCKFYAVSGDLITYPDYGQPESRQDRSNCITPSWDFLRSLSPEKFYSLYQNALPAALDPVKKT